VVHAADLQHQPGALQRRVRGRHALSLPNPVFVGDTLWAESEVLERRESRSRPTVGIVGVRTRGINQRREVVCEYRRSFMVYKRDAPEVAGGLPQTSAAWAQSSDGEGDPA
jgi:hypothetical protein